MFVGESGITRTILATLLAMNDANIEDPYDTENIRKLGVIDLPTIQRKLNFHYSVSLDLFGQEISTNAANSFNAGIKGRYMESKLEDDHQLTDDTYAVKTIQDGKILAEDVPALTAINMRLRDDYIRDVSRGIKRWNNVIRRHGIQYEMKVPSEAFHRQIGVFSAIHTDVGGNVICKEQWDANVADWLPTPQDHEFIQSLMQPCYEPGEFASWIAPPRVGINNMPGDFEYVKLHMA